MKPAAGIWLAAVVGTPLVFAGCNNDCDFFERCSGDERQVCGDGPDQMFNRKVHRYPCADGSPNTACVELDDDHAACVLPARTACDDGFDRHCEEQTLIVCSGVLGYSDPSNEPRRYLVGVACEDDDRTCVDYGRDASCVDGR